MPPRRSTPKIMHRAGELRKEPTPAESKLWLLLRTLRADGIHFRRQHALGPYIVDFAAPRRKLIIEIDGSQHLNQQEYDAQRTMYLEEAGWYVLRFWDSEVMKKPEEVMGIILKELKR